MVLRDNLAEDAAALAPKVAAPKRAPAREDAPKPAPEIEPTSAAPVETAAADPAPRPDDESPLDTASPSVATSEVEDEDPQLGLQVGVGLGVVSRTFTPGPSTVAGYSASPVGAVSFAAQIRPARRFCLDALVDRTLSMATPMGNDMADTTMSRWEVSGEYMLARGRVTLATRLGLGRRAFAIESIAAGRTPDSDYNYLIVGATASASLGTHVVVRGLAAFEPVLWGTEPTEMAFGEARRWAVDVGAALEVRVREHIYTRLSADLQRFAWAWAGAGERGAGGAVDVFPSATASVGAMY